MSSLNISLRNFIASSSPVMHTQRAISTYQGHRLRDVSRRVDLYVEQARRLTAGGDCRFAKNAPVHMKLCVSGFARISIPSITPFAGRRGAAVCDGALAGLLLSINPVRHTVIAALMGAAHGVWPTVGALILAYLASAVMPTLLEEAILFLVGTGKEHAGRTFDIARGLPASQVRPAPGPWKQAGLLGTLCEAIPLEAATQFEERGHNALATVCLVGASIGHIGVELLRGVGVVASLAARIAVLPLFVIVSGSVALVLLSVILTADMLRSWTHSPNSAVQIPEAA